MTKTIEVIKPIKVRKPGETTSTASKRRVAAYARVSTDYEDQLNSYKVQCEEYTKTITSNPDYIFAGLFADQGLSGTQAKKRPEFMKMIECARNGEIDLILTKSISRFGRNTVDVITYIRELRAINVELFFEKENISSLDSKIDFMLTILSSIAQEESRAISSNVKWAIEKKAKNGIVDPRRIYGYNIEEGKYVINEEEAEVVRQMFTLAMKRFNINDIVKTLNVSGYRTLKGSTWKYGTVRHILQNERYCGDALLRKTVCIDYLTKKTVKNDNIVDKYYVSNNHVPIITKQMFDNVQSILSNSNATIRNLNKTSKYPLTGILFCPKCCRTLKRQQVTSGSNKNVVLNCNHSYGNTFACKSGSPKYDLVIGAAVESVKELFVNKSVLNSLFEVFDNNVALNNLRDQQAQIKSDNVELHNLLADSPDNEEIIKQIIHNDATLNVLADEISLGASSSVRLEYIKSLVDSDIHDDAICFKDIYSLVISDEQKVRFVISPSKAITELVSDIPKILECESVLSKMHFSKDSKSGIFYEVVFYE